MPEIYPEKKVFAIGVDPGGHAETSALSVVECVKPPDWDPAESCPGEFLQHHVRYLHQFLPPTTTSDIIQCVIDVLSVIERPQPDELDEISPTGNQPGKGVRMFQKKSHPKVLIETYLVLDRTAIGDATAEMFGRKVGRPVCPVIIEGQHVDTYSSGLHHLPKQNVISGMDMLLEEYRLKIAEGLPGAMKLTQELIHYRNRPTSAASLNSDTWRERPSDDLVFATGIASWRLRKLPYLKIEPF